jgi:adenylate cyclase
MTIDLRSTRANLRLISALIMLAFVVSHLSAHGFLLVSIEQAEHVLGVLMEPWRTATGTVVLSAAFLVHYGNALWSIYVRRSLRMSRWEWSQLALGLCIPVLVILHVVGTRVAFLALDVQTSYALTLTTLWVAAPWAGVVQTAALITIWLHACIGIHFWLRTKGWYRDRQVYFGAVALLLPALALSGYVAAGNQIRREAARSPDFVRQLQQESNIDAAKVAAVYQIAYAGLTLHIVLVVLPFAARAGRSWLHRRRKPPTLTNAAGRTFVIMPGATVLETLRDNGIPHASVCGGRARCTTCRVLVKEGLNKLPQPAPLEQKALARIQAPSGVRLACQIRPTADIAIVPLLAADASAEDGSVRGGLEGSERPITVVFVDLRGSTAIGEARMPYDVLFLLNQFFGEMTKALAATNGHYSQFTGDGLMALYGLNEPDPAKGAADAMHGANEMLARLDRLNRALHVDLSQPLRIGIGIHHSDAIVGVMGPPKSQIITAIGDTVNTCARLESLTKEFNCSIIVSREAAEAARLDIDGLTLHEVPVKGRSASVQFYAFDKLPSVRS